MHTEFWSDILKGRDHSEGLDVGRKTILKWVLKRQVGKVWTVFIWLRVRTSGGLFWTRWWALEYHKSLGISWPAEWLL